MHDRELEDLGIVTLSYPFGKGQKSSWMNKFTPMDASLHVKDSKTTLHVKDSKTTRGFQNNSEISLEFNDDLDSSESDNNLQQSARSSHPN